MMILSNFIFLPLSIVVLIMVTCTATTKVPQSIEEGSQSYNADEQHLTPALTDHHQTVDDSKQVALSDDDSLSTSNSDEEYNDYHRHYHNQAIFPEVVNKRFTKKMIRTGNSAVNGGDNRLWAIPYRFGKRAAMPYRFGKRGAAMHFRLGKKSASL